MHLYRVSWLIDRLPGLLKCVYHRRIQNVDGLCQWMIVGKKCVEGMMYESWLTRCRRLKVFWSNSGNWMGQ